MSDQSPDREPETVDDEVADQAAELILEANEQYQQNRQEQQEFLDTVAEEEGAEVLETKCDIHGHTIEVSAKLNGEIMDAMGAIEDRMERLEHEEGHAYEVSETADELSQLLADVTDDPMLHKRAFYEQYEQEGLEPLGAILEEVFEALETERKRREGAADGFRKQ